MKLPYINSLTPIFVLLACCAALLNTASAQSFDGMERNRMKDMLSVVKNDIKKRYYDPTFHGINMDERFKKAEERLDQVKSAPEALAVIAQTLIDFNDSHLYFMPPST